MLRAAVVCVALVFCVADALTCRERRRQLEGGPALLGRPMPHCEADGSYSAKQCVGSGCFCVNAEGKKIQGYDTHISEAANMDCRCARDKYNYEQTGLIGLQFQCSDNGSYLPYRCVGSVCFCSDSYGQPKANSASVNIGHLDSLRC